MKKLFTFFICCFAFTSIYAKPVLFGHRQDVKHFILKMHTNNHFDTRKLTALFDTVHPSKTIIDQISHPSEAKPWYEYRELFVTPKRVHDGVIFWKMHRLTLMRAEKKYHVPASIIVAIIGIESNYGKNTGKFPVLNSLSTLAFNYPARASFFQYELGEFLLLTREKHIDPKQVKGSYAGAIGQPQFMPDSFRHYAVDFSGNSKINLSHNIMDVIGSIANYFHLHGWHYHRLIAKPIKQAQIHTPLRVFDPFQDNVRELPITKYNIYAIVKLNEHNRSEYWKVYKDFAVIMKYNASIHYSMAAFQLASAIKHDYVKSLKEKVHDKK